MSRSGKHRIKKERPETSSSIPDIQDRDLTYFIHDRVELMHQVFSVLKSKELKAMTPLCVQHISLNDLQELCTEELLGISSKRLCAILDGADPPSDTDTSSASSLEKFETISLDSISSDEEILSQGSGKKKKHKHCRHKSKNKKRKSSETENVEKSTASRAGLTVLELLELQARARAIRAQLQQEQPIDITEKAPATVQHVSDDEVEIKEEPTEVVEISSEDEKPKIEELQKEIAQQSKTVTPIINEINKETHITKKINDLIITVPQTKHTRKIKLNRNTPKTIPNITINNPIIEKEKPQEQSIEKTNMNQNKETTSQKITKEKQKKKIKKKEKKKKEGSDHDEITLQLSDSEKMDLLENLDRKNYDSVSSSSTDSDSTDSEEEKNTEETENIENISDKEKTETTELKIDENNDVSEKESSPTKEKTAITEKPLIKETPQLKNNEQIAENDKEKSPTASQEAENEITPIAEETMKPIEKVIEESTSEKQNNTPSETINTVLPVIEAVTSLEETEKEINKVKDTDTNKNIEKSDGELSDRESSEVEASDVRPEVVCISDEETTKKNQKKKKNKKKEKKSKKDKKKNQDFRNGGDQNFYTKPETTIIEAPEILEENYIDDDVYEILELSDESSCNGEDGTSVLSKEPTAEEIEALSAKIDEIERENIVTDEEIREHERLQAEKDVTEAEGISWKDRYLDSKKVKSVLTTANILNAMRKKNKELKRQLEESKKEIPEIIEVPEKIETETENLEEGSIEQYNTLEGSTKYVDPVNENEANDTKVTKEMKKDAKQLLKMYKKLLKYNDMSRQKDPNKKKKKKQRKNKEEKNKMEDNAKIIS